MDIGQNIKDFPLFRPGPPSLGRYLLDLFSIFFDNFWFAEKLRSRSFQRIWCLFMSNAKVADIFGVENQQIRDFQFWEDAHP